MKCKFTSKEFFPYQTDLILKIKNSKKRIIGLNLPTGTGKTLIAINSIDPPFYYLCHSKVLQRQLYNETKFPYLVGKRNYPETQLWLRDYNKIKNSDYAILNYHVYFYHHFPKRNLICDEADILEELLDDYFGIDLYLFEYEQKHKIRIKRPTSLTDTDIGIQFISNLFKRTADTYNQQKLRRLLLNEDLFYFYYPPEDRFILRPFRYSPKALELYFLKGSPKVLLMSATLPPKQYLEEFFQQEVDYFEEDPHLEGQKYFFHFPCCVSLKGKELDENEIIKAADYLMREVFPRHRGRILIHTVNYDLQNKLKECLLGYVRPFLFVNGNRPAWEYIEDFKLTPSAVLFSPYFYRGLDLKGELCEAVVWVKPPYIDLSDPFVLKKKESSHMWYVLSAIVKTIQGAGRGVRGIEDTCHVYFLAKEFDILFNHLDLLPKWFKNKLVEGEYALY
ncbi:MAG: helicase C-terminal domain-containing protein [Thermoplasmata archaeon]